MFLDRAVRQPDLTVDAKARAERAAAVPDVQVRVVERMGAGMLVFRRAPAWPWQPVVITPGGAVLRLQCDEVEVLLVRHVELEALRRLTAITGRPPPSVDLAQDFFGHRHVVFDLYVLEHPVSETGLVGEP